MDGDDTLDDHGDDTMDGDDTLEDHGDDTLDDHGDDTLDGDDTLEDHGDDTLDVHGDEDKGNAVKKSKYRRLRSLSTGAYRSNSGGMGAKKRARAYYREY